MSDQNIISLASGSRPVSFHLHNVPGDGNCFFHCLSLAEHGNLSMSSNYRQTICSEVLSNWDFFKHHIELEQQTDLSYYQNMILGNEYASSCEIEVAARLINRQINVWLECRNSNKEVSHVLTTFNSTSNAQPINLLLRYTHFQFMTLVHCEQNQATAVTSKPCEQNQATAVKSKPCEQNQATAVTSKPENYQNNFSSDHTYHKTTSNCSFPDTYVTSNTEDKHDHSYSCLTSIGTNKPENDQTNFSSDHTYHKTTCTSNSSYSCSVSSSNENLYQEHSYAKVPSSISKQTSKIVHESSNTNNLNNDPSNSNTSASMNLFLPNTENSQINEQENVNELHQETVCSHAAISSSKLHMEINVGTKSTSNKRPMPNKSSTSNKKSRTEIFAPEHEKALQELCRTFGVLYESPVEDETYERYKLRKRKLLRRIQSQKEKLSLQESNIPPPPPLVDDSKFNTAMDSVRNFELQQMSYSFKFCSICKERRLEMKMATNESCHRCHTDNKNKIKMFSPQNNMDPGTLPDELKDLTIIEQQLICRISPCINVHMLNHGGIASSGHCVTFPQEINEPAKIFPKLPHEIQIIKVRKNGKNDTSKEFRVRRMKIEQALRWLKAHNTAYSDIIISNDRLLTIPEDGQFTDITTLEFRDTTTHNNDTGPSKEQIDIGVSEGFTHSTAQLPDSNVNLREKVENIITEILGNNHEPVTVNRQGTITIPWPTRDNNPVSEFTTQHFFTLAFPALFPYGTGDYYINRPITMSSMVGWAEHLLWYNDGRFAKHPYFKFVVHNMIMRKQVIERSSFIMTQKLGDQHFTINDLKKLIENGDTSVSKKILYFSGNLRGTTQYWERRAKELRSLVQYNINEGKGLPSFFTTGSCAEFHFKPLKRLLSMYVSQTTGYSPDLSDKNILFKTLQENTHIVAQYFDLRTQSYFKAVMGPVFGVDCYWYRQEFAKSRGMVHWHGLCWRSDRQPHDLLHDAVTAGLSEDQCAEKVSAWARENFGMTATHPAGQDDCGNPVKNMWPPPEGTAPAPPEDSSPLFKLLMDVSTSQESLLEDHLLLTNRFNLHRCSDYCLRSSKSNISKKICRMEFPKQIRSTPAIVKDRNGSMRLEMKRDHPVLVQHSRIHTQGWRANGDISLIISKSNPSNPSVNEILATEKYITGYACKGNEPTGALSDLFSDMINSVDADSDATAKSLCTKLLMNSVKRDVSAVEACYEISSIPLYRSSHSFQSVSLSGCRVLHPEGIHTITKNTIIDKYISRHVNDTSSLYQFICKNGKVPVIAGPTQANWPLEENFCRTTLILHVPNWRCLTDIKENDMSWTEKFTSFLETEICPNFIKADVQRAKGIPENVEAEEQHENIDASDEINECQEWMEVIRPNRNFDEPTKAFQFDDGGPDHDWNATTTIYPQDHGHQWWDTITKASHQGESLTIPNVDLSKMNKQQLLAFNIVMETLLQFSNKSDNYTPLRMIVSGTAGSGKSFLIKCLVKAIRLFFQNNKSVQVLCPTGNSANLISGVTLHSFLKIPTRFRGGEMKAPDGSIGESLQENCSNLHAILVDERSLIGSTTLGWMDFHCRNGTGIANQTWGGVPVVVFLGDDVQLPPVLDTPVYHSKNKSPASIHGVLVWQEFKTAVHLETVIRQGEEEHELRDVLASLREYKTTPSQTLWLQQFQWNNLQRSKGEALLERMMNKGLFVFPTHDEEWQHNKTKLLHVNSLFPIAKMTSVSKGVHAKTCESEKAGGLQHTVYLCKKSKVMLSVNLCVPFGLFNGAIGIVEDILYFNGKKPPELPDVAMVEFPNYNGPPFMSENTKLVPIFPVERKMDCPCHFCRRKQIPLRLGWATTIHRCQGMTIGEGEVNRYIIINPGTRAFESRNPGALFVALSRAKSTGKNCTDPDFAWHPSFLLNEDRLCHKVNTPTTSAREKEISRIKSMAKETAIKFQNLTDDPDLSNLLLKFSIPSIAEE